MAVRPIDANVAMKKIREYMEDFPNAHTRLTACRAILSMLGDENQMPTLTPPNEPITLEQGLVRTVSHVRHGYWYDCGSLSCRCSECGCKNNRETAYCPNCGVRMDKENEVEY